MIHDEPAGAGAGTRMSFRAPALFAAIELHRPVWYDRYDRPQDAEPVDAEPADDARWRCAECSCWVEERGCRTWQVANLD